MQPLCVSISTLLLSVLLPWPGAGEIHVIGPEAPVVASVGEEAVLPCHLSPETDAEGMEVTWYKINPSGLVHHYAESQDILEQQRSEYRGRTEFLKENIDKGQVALKIHPIHISDDGEYRCLFASSTFETEARFKVLVTVSGMAPRIHIDPGNTGEVKLTCTSMGWYPEPKMQWRDLQGQPLTPASETITIDGNGLFHVETSVTVNAVLKDVSCVIRNPVLSEEKEAHVSVSDAVFPRLWPWIVGFAVPLCLLAAGTTFFILFVRTRRKKGLLKKKYEISHEERKYFIDKLYADKDCLAEVNGLNKARRFAEDIVLDKTTAHPRLEVSDDGKSVVIGKKEQDLPDNPERFDTVPALLGENSFSDGDHYWEVEVSGKKSWVIGLCVESTERKGNKILRIPENGFWTIVRKNDVYKAWTSPNTTLDVLEPPLTVGIFLLYEKGLISFYNLTDLTILYTFKGIFTEPLKPYFSLLNHDKELGMGLVIPKVSVIDPITVPKNISQESQ